ncbi:hypothetical protein [Variovorax boronicumulans]|uniref:hypothetical protein n=1 Tax=Variovorax boronicumulans TaxID=436515 RepID=UPI003398B105
MKNVSTFSGRLISASVMGSQPTVKDMMVAGQVYLSELEEQFTSTHHLLACYSAWKESDLLQPAEMLEEQLDKARQWIKAHKHADELAKQWLSDPGNQSFELRMTAR